MTQSDTRPKSPQAKPIEYRIILIGSHHKQPLEHTGSREMAIRKAEGAILCYAAFSIASFHQLSGIAEDFKLRKGVKYPPVTLICNEDEIVDDDNYESSSTAAGSSTSEGYESEEPHHPHSIPRRRSMENIRKAHEDARISLEQGENMAKLFGPDCRFLNLSLLSFEDGRQLMEDLIRTINKSNPDKLKDAKKRMKPKSLNGVRRKSKPGTDDEGSIPSGSTDGTPIMENPPNFVGQEEIVVEKGSKKLKKVIKSSKVCVVM